VLPVFQNAVATSYFKMSKWYVAANGVMAGAAFDVARQPCQPGLIQIGTLDGTAPPNPVCLCCPNPLPQFFSLGLETVVLQSCAAQAPAPPAAPVAGPPMRAQTNPHGCVWNWCFGTSWM